MRRNLFCWILHHIRDALGSTCWCRLGNSTAHRRGLRNASWCSDMSGGWCTCLDLGCSASRLAGRGLGSGFLGVAFGVAFRVGLVGGGGFEGAVKGFAKLLHGGAYLADALWCPRAGN